MARNPVGWFEIYVQDMARSRAFYEVVLGVTLTRLAVDALEMWAFPMDDGALGASGSLVQAPGMPSGGNSTMVYFSSADCAAEAGRVEAAGGRLERQKMSIGQYGFVAIARDPDGNVFGLHSMA